MQNVTYRLNLSNMRPLMTTIWNNLQDWLAGNPDLEICIRPYKSKRSIEQNRRLWKIYQHLSETVWVDVRRFDPETWHEYCKGKFIGYDVIAMPDGSEIRRPMSSAKLNTAEMTDYQNNIQAWAAAEFGVIWEF